ncbi:MAG: tRNA lysidine(34) synthetase TilS [Lautropia sp.]
MGASRNRPADASPPASLDDTPTAPGAGPAAVLGAAIIDALASVEPGAASGAPIVLACSGGRDSMALVEAAVAVLPRTRLVLAHVHHGLVAQADDWLEHCRATATRHAIAFRYRRLAGVSGRSRFDGLGLEGWARRERYRALADIARACGAPAVLTAHHLQDQAETVRLQALRGAGARGLAGMVASRPIDATGDGPLLLRPFLDLEPSRLAAVMDETGARWVDDPSNTDPRRARTAQRRAIEAALASGLDVFAGVRRRLAAARDEWAIEEADAIAALDACRLQGVGLQAGGVLLRDRLAALPAARQGIVIRQWLASAGCAMPTRARLLAVREQLVGSAASQARLQVSGRWIVRYRDRIAIVDALPAALQPQPLPSGARDGWIVEIVHCGEGRHARARFVDATRGAPTGAGADRVSPAARGGAPTAPQPDLVLVACRAADRLRLAPGAPSRSWKNLCQEAGIPAWLRPCLPALRDARSGRLRYAAPFGVLASDDADHGRVAPPHALRVRWACPPQWRVWLSGADGAAHPATAADRAPL